MKSYPVHQLYDIYIVLTSDCADVSDGWGGEEDKTHISNIEHNNSHTQVHGDSYRPIPEGMCGKVRHISIISSWL